jgi:energy-coupling factor transporter ATP-binding protein EcfA2
MKSRLHRIEIRNFKAFREFTLDLEGRHLLVYGANGAGKSSLYWALYTFLQSARKNPKGCIAKYFEPDGPENLLNIHEDAVAKPGEIAMTLRDVATKIDTTYRISKADHSTHQQPAILKGDLASDFITYRFFFGFSDFKNSQKFNVWPLFEKEILPFCVSTGGNVPLDCWNAIKASEPNPEAYSGYAGADAYQAFHKSTSEFAAMLPGIIDAISAEAQKFYDQHFSAGDPAPIKLRLGVTTLPASSGGNQQSFQFAIPVVEFGIQVPGKPAITRPQSYLNEAKLTQLALCVRFAASLVNLRESDLKFLVLDDLLVSLDMSNRMKVVEILLSDAFAGYQKIILTHELGFFREFRRKLGASHPDWCFLRLAGSADTKIEGKCEKTDIQKAEEYLHGHSLDEAAVCLRKAADDMATRYREWTDGKKLPPGEFFSLTENLRAARQRLLEKLPARLYARVLLGTPAAQRDHLVPANDGDIDALIAVDVADRGRLKSARRNLRTLLKDENWKVMENIKLIDEVLNTTERVLNPGAHGGDTPLYEHEIQNALDLLAKLETCLA